MKAYLSWNSQVFQAILGFLLFSSTCLFAVGSCRAMGVSPPAHVPDAVNLLVKKHYRVNPDGSYSMDIYFKTRLNTYKGKKDRGDFKLGYNSVFEKVEVRLARTILPDGRIIEVGQKEINDIIDPSTQRASIFSGARLKIVNFPSVEKGCTIELEMVKQSRLGFWGMESFRLSDPCRQKTVIIDTPADMPVNFQLAFKKVRFSESRKGDRRILEWTGRQLEKAPDDPLSPMVENLESTLVFSSFRSWKQVGSWFRDILLGGRGMHQGHIVPKALESAGEPADLYCLLAKRLEILPISLFNTRLSFQSPGQTLRSGYGTGIDAALLFYHVLRSRGLDPELVAASSRGVWVRGMENTFYPGSFDTLLVRVGGRYYSFDRKDLSPGVTGMDGQMVLALDSGKFETVRDVSRSRTVVRYNVEVSDPSSGEYRFRSRQSGMSAQKVRRLFKDLTPEEFKVRSSVFFHSLNCLARPAAGLNLSDLDPAAGPVEMEASYRVRGFFITNGNSFVLPIPRSSRLDAVAACPEGRKLSLFIRRQESAEIEFDLTMPESYKISAVPWNMKGSVGPVSWENFCTGSGHTLHCVRSLTLKRGFVRRGKEFRKLKQAVFGLIDPVQNSLRFQPGN